MMAALVTKLLRRDDLGEDEAAAAMDLVMRGEAHPAQLAGLLVGLAMKGERPAELVGLARTMRARGVTIEAGGDAIDTCGTGGDRAGTFNISTAAAIVVAGAGLPVVKHGNRSVSSHCGSADVLEALGVTITAPPAVVQQALTDAGLAFCFAPTFHPAMRHAVDARRALGVPTAFNLLGPLTNPARVPYQVVGVARPELTELMARALQQLGARRAWVVHGADGLDELSTTGYTKVSECHGDVVRTFYLHPADVGLPKAAPAALRGATAADNAAIIRGVLAGEPGPARDVVLLNAGAALFIAGRAASLRDAIALAAAAVADGAAGRALDALVRITGQGA
ncbi:MAG: anthranilate phosphoribosyltransferase [Vicinamibacterales bacterium]